jgi:hypothetical protein
LFSCCPSFLFYQASMLVHCSYFLNIFICFCKLFAFFHALTCFGHHICIFCKCSTCEMILHHNKLVNDIILLLFLIVCCVISFLQSFLFLASYFLWFIVSFIVCKCFLHGKLATTTFFNHFWCCFEVFFWSFVSNYSFSWQMLKLQWWQSTSSFWCCFNFWNICFL